MQISSMHSRDLLECLISRQLQDYYSIEVFELMFIVGNEWMIEGIAVILEELLKMAEDVINNKIRRHYHEVSFIYNYLLGL